LHRFGFSFHQREVDAHLNPCLILPH
jgi:hypothetical protein